MAVFHLYPACIYSTLSIRPGCLARVALRTWPGLLSGVRGSVWGLGEFKLSSGRGYRSCQSTYADHRNQTALGCLIIRPCSALRSSCFSVYIVFVLHCGIWDILGFEAAVIRGGYLVLYLLLLDSCASLMRLLSSEIIPSASLCASRHDFTPLSLAGVSFVGCGIFYM